MPCVIRTIAISLSQLTQRYDMFSLRKLRRLAGFIAAALVFTQVVYAAEACVHSQISSADAVNMQDMADCAGMKSTASCLAQCSAGDQNTASSVIAIPDAPLSHVRVSPVALIEQLPRVNWDTPAPGCEPSRPIRYCSFLL